MVLRGRCHRLVMYAQCEMLNVAFRLRTSEMLGNAQRGTNSGECAAWGRPSHFRMRSTNIFRGGEFCECSVRRIPARSTTWAWNDTRNLKTHTNLTKTPNPPNPVRIRHRIEKI